MAKFKISTKNAGGTSLQGLVTTSYSKLVEIFGEPQESDGYKVSSEWVVEDDNGNVLTIYDYKETSLYDSNNPSVEEFRELPECEWHIGGNNPSLADELEQFILAQ